MNELLLPAPVTAGAKGGEAGTGADPWKDASYFSLDYYKQFFDVDTDQVVFRIKSSFWPIKNTFMAQVAGKGDMYGPIWVSSTLIFMMAFAGNIVDWKESYKTNNVDGWHYDFNKVTLAATVIYTYITVIPLLLWAVFKYSATNPPSLLDTITVYGYSMFVYIPAAIVCIFPWIGSSIDWLAISVAMITSGSVLLINFWKAAQEAKRPWILGAIALCHIGLSLAFKFYFFRHTAAVAPPPTPPTNTTLAPLVTAAAATAAAAVAPAVTLAAATVAALADAAAVTIAPSAAPNSGPSPPMAHALAVTPAVTAADSPVETVASPPPPTREKPPCPDLSGGINTISCQCGDGLKRIKIKSNEVKGYKCVVLDASDIEEVLEVVGTAAPSPP
jgi:hypothetical protein